MNFSPKKCEPLLDVYLILRNQMDTDFETMSSAYEIIWTYCANAILRQFHQKCLKAVIVVI